MGSVSTNPGAYAREVTKSDSTIVESRGVYVGGAGDLVVEMEAEGNEVTFASVPAGTLLPIRVMRVKSATTATDVVVVY